MTTSRSGSCRLCTLCRWASSRGKWFTIQICHVPNAWEAKKNPGTEPKTCEKGPKLGFEYLPTSKTLHCVRTACMAFPKTQNVTPTKSNHHPCHCHKLGAKDGPNSWTRREGTPNCLVRWGQKQARVGNGQKKMPSALTLPLLRGVGGPVGVGGWCGTPPPTSGGAELLKGALVSGPSGGVFAQRQLLRCLSWKHP